MGKISTMKIRNTLRHRLAIFFSCPHCGGWGAIDIVSPVSFGPPDYEPIQTWTQEPCEACNATGYRFWIGRLYGALELRFWLWRKRRVIKRLGAKFADGTEDPFHSE